MGWHNQPASAPVSRELKPGAKVIIYHTGEERSAVGTARVLSVDAADPKSPVVRIKAGKRLAQAVPLAAIKANRLFAQSPLLKQGRLSVVPLSDEQLASCLRGEMTRACFKNSSAGLGVFPQGYKARIFVGSGRRG